MGAIGLGILYWRERRMHRAKLGKWGEDGKLEGALERLFLSTG